MEIMLIPVCDISYQANSFFATQKQSVFKIKYIQEISKWVKTAQDILGL